MGGGGGEGCTSPRFGVHDRRERTEGKLQVLFRLVQARLSVHTILNLLFLARGSGPSIFSAERQACIPAVLESELSANSAHFARCDHREAIAC